jgi:hypothetical protein
MGWLIGIADRSNISSDFSRQFPVSALRLGWWKEEDILLSITTRR